ncbi:amidohydrolase family protein [Viridibacillus arvi]|uniref:amidohydrolase family protein n=1 Tax=Viridibacillus arvi TaxID=263475 RepID=UPI0034D013E8
MKIFDAHLHIIDFDFPIQENQGYIPPSFLVEDYRHATKEFEIIGGAIVSGSFQGYDQGYLINALKELGPSFYGVTQLPFNTTDQNILQLNDHGVRALRFNIKRGGSEDLSQLDYFARRVYDLVGWHSEIYIDAKDLIEIKEVIRKLPAISIDHLGLSEEGLPILLDLVESGVHVKATGFGRVELDVVKAMKAIHEVNHDALMFGTDLPSTRAKRPFDIKDIHVILEKFETKNANRILYENAVKWYSCKKV